MSLTRFRSSDRQKVRGATLPPQSRRFSASKQTSIRRACRDAKSHGNDVRECKNDFETSQDAFAASGFRLAPGSFGLLRKSGFNRIKLRIFRLERRKTERRAK